MSQQDKSKKEFLTENPVRVLDLSELLEERGIRPEYIVAQEPIDEDGKLAIQLSKLGARRSAERECSGK